MKQTVNLCDFRDAFRNLRPDNFSYEGLELLFDHLQQLEFETGEELELDVIALCCDFCENDIDDVIEEYGIEISDESNKFDEVYEYLDGEYGVIGTVNNTSFVYQKF